MVIFVDADGCPVVNITVELAKKYDLHIIIVKNYAVEIQDDYAEIVTVDISRDSADYYIANRIQKGDILISQDYGLAAMCLAKEAICLNQNGLIISKDNIDGILNRRHLNQKLRRENKIYSKFKKRNPQANEDFRRNLDLQILRMLGTG
ncbi:YaiI/YqxD family protein [Tissierella creatinini]|nr:YaiI/YqxD family protein [Tissierella creatinini]TJX66164.1 YaiI/YqxD family protein [Soehngenia saccharolytica]